MKFEKWNLPAAAPSVEALEAAGYPALLSAVLAAHGIADTAAAAEFLNIEETLTLSPFLMKDMDCAVRRIRAALEGGGISPYSATMTWTASPPRCCCWTI